MKRNLFQSTVETQKEKLKRNLVKSTGDLSSCSELNMRCKADVKAPSREGSSPVLDYYFDVDDNATTLCVEARRHLY